MSSIRSGFLITLVLAAVAMAGPWSASPADAAKQTISENSELLQNPAALPNSGEPDIGQTAPNSSQAPRDEDSGGIVIQFRRIWSVWTARWAGLGL